MGIEQPNGFLVERRGRAPGGFFFCEAAWSRSKRIFFFVSGVGALQGNGVTRPLVLVTIQYNMRIFSKWGLP